MAVDGTRIALQFRDNLFGGGTVGDDGGAAGATEEEVPLLASLCTYLSSSFRGVIEKCEGLLQFRRGSLLPDIALEIER
eukprot:348773-Rhodomonas_salina.1